MDDFAISVRNVSKSFRRYRHPTDRLKELLFPGHQKYQEFWALQNVSLEVPKGQTLGIVGRNGSGKSTLLQIIVGTLMPTDGEVNVNGRISALLELGSGFNPEFTGRQNVFFNGQLLGLTKQQIEERFEDIVAFADIGDFIDQPAKTYSSGMFVRLAFAVATSVDPDILVVDEALAVGDEAFQRKCFSRIEALQSRGGTTLFVSHSASKVVELCDRALLLDRGEMLLFHEPKFTIDRYHKLIYAPADLCESFREEIRHTPNLDPHAELDRDDGGTPTPQTPEESPSDGDFFDPHLVPKNTISYIPRGAKIANPQIVTPDGRTVNHLTGRQEYVYTYKVTFYKTATKVRFGMLVKTVSGLELGGASFTASSQSIDRVEANTTVTVRFRFQCLLNPGAYFLNAGVSGVVEGQFTYLARGIDIAMFRVRPDNDSFASGIVDLLIDPHVSLDAEVETVEMRSNPAREPKVESL
ncbi:ABC transporter ATP-binding protein [Baaleninema sp.]|uniref:ABC transporter ATP-binding protein n=1 Tax=Baaleninema sp. TaxID=3101197 RepID=UPI003CFF3966